MKKLEPLIIPSLLVIISLLLYVNVSLSKTGEVEPEAFPTPEIQGSNVKIITPTLVPIPTLIPTPKPRSLDGGKLFNLVNDYRRKNGLNELLWYHPLCEFAKARSQQIKGDWSHEGYLKEATEGALYSSICPECGLTGENLAKGYYSEEAALQGWINSPTHKANLDSNWDWGCAMYYSNNYVSILFGKKK